MDIKLQLRLLKLSQNNSIANENKVKNIINIKYIYDIYLL